MSFAGSSPAGGRISFSPDDGMVDVSDLGSEFWEFESPSGYTFLNSPLGGTVDTAALKAALSGCRFESDSG